MKENPKYLQIEDDIRTEITTGQLKINDQIMTEAQLCKKYGVSRMTINKAISNLAASGYIHRVPGKGSFVRNPHMIKTIGQGQSFTDDMESLGLKAGSKLLEYCVKRGAEVPEAAAKLNLGEEDLIHYFVRLRTGDDLPIAISYTYVSGQCIPAIAVSCLEQSFYKYVAELGLKIGAVDAEMTAVMPSEFQQEVLGIRNEALLLNAHTTFLQDGTPMEYIKTYYVGSRYSYRFSGNSQR